MPDKRTITFKIPEVRPEDIPAHLLADHIRDLAVLFGDDSVSLVNISDSSTNLAFLMPIETAMIAHEKLQSAANNEGTPEENRAFQNVDTRLRNYGQTGVMLDEQKAKIIEFPGKLKEMIAKFPAVTQNAIVEGIPIRVGSDSPKENVPVHLQDGDIIHFCTAPRDKAAQIAEFGMFKALVRVTGEARWTRGFDGEWYRTRFYVQDCDVLDDSESLLETIARLRAVPDNGWRDIPDPMKALSRIRHGDME